MIQIFLSDQHGLNTLEYQPAKLAAIEGHYDTALPAPLTLFIPDDTAAVMRDPAAYGPERGRGQGGEDMDR